MNIYYLICRAFSFSTQNNMFLLCCSFVIQCYFVRRRSHPSSGAWHPSNGTWLANQSLLCEFHPSSTWDAHLCCVSYTALVFLDKICQKINVSLGCNWYRNSYLHACLISYNQSCFLVLLFILDQVFCVGTKLNEVNQIVGIWKLWD
jgi:hypothetical protein